ncbi:MAG: serine/threonine-protein phosphatase [Clostridia bacterium]|nr:serine/threonine-protein phosphatase [Clostridia bacterium]
MTTYYKGISKKGDRARNEDSIAVFKRDDACCFVLCDGLGGHGKGDRASSIACHAFGEVFERTFEFYPRSFFREAIAQANRDILAAQQTEDFAGGMKTTLVALLVCKGYCTWCHIGDSRLYLFQNNDLTCRTMDHSVPQMLVNSGTIKEKDIRFHPDRNRLLRALGNDEDPVRYDVSSPYKLAECQAFLLCSDGFWEYIDEKQMKKLLQKSKDADEWLNRMQAVVLENGVGKNMDNYSAIVVMNSNV